MSLQILFCVEADRRSGTDWIYIRSVIDKYYKLDNSISIKPVYLGGKTNYKRTKVTSEIARATREFRKTGKTVVIYCIDTDDWNTDPDRERELSEVVCYCESKQYEMIWFCRDIEEVFWGSRVASSDKRDYAKRFRSNSMINDLPITRLNKETMSIGFSNILQILDKYLHSRCNI